MPFFLAPTTESPDEPPRLRTVWRFLIFGLGFVVSQLMIGVGVGIVWVIWLIAGGHLGGAIDPVALEGMVNDWLPTLAAISAVPSAGLSLGLCAVCRRYLDCRPVATMGLVRPRGGLTTGIVPGFLFGMAPIALAALGLWGVGAFDFRGVTLPTQALYMAPAFVFLAFQEEIIFRGYLYQNLLDIRRGVFGIVFTSAVFWLVHGFNPAAWSSPVVSVNLFGAGIVLAAAYRFSGNLWFPTAMHFAWNFTQGVLFGIPVSGMALEGIVKLERNDASPDLLTGGEFGLEGSLVVTVLEVVMGVLLLWAGRGRGRVEETEGGTDGGTEGPREGEGFDERKADESSAVSDE